MKVLFIHFAILILCSNVDKTFAVTMYNPDTPKGSRWWHMVAFDIQSNINELLAGTGSTKFSLAPRDAI